MALEVVVVFVLKHTAKRFSDCATLPWRHIHLAATA